MKSISEYMHALYEFEFHMPDFNISDVKLLFCGHEQCTPGQYNSPTIRDYYVLHLVLSGKGTLTVNKRTYNISERMGFLFNPGIMTYYKADMKNPWEYVWLGISGKSLEKLLRNSNITPDMPIFLPDDFDKMYTLVFEIIQNISIGGTANIIKCYSHLLMFLSLLLQHTSVYDDKSSAQSIKSVTEHYIGNAIGYIKDNICRNITVSTISRSLGLNRSYFSKIFKEKCGIPPMKFLLAYRLNNAWHLLQYTDLPIERIAYEVGFADPAYFTRQFTRRYGRSPLSLRRYFLIHGIREKRLR